MTLFWVSFTLLPYHFVGTMFPLPIAWPYQRPTDYRLLVSKGMVQKLAYVPYITPELFRLGREAVHASKTVIFFVFCEGVQILSSVQYRSTVV